MGALATYVRPIGSLLVPCVLLAWGLWPGRRRQALVFALLFVSLLAPWVLRNRAVAGFTGFSSVPQVNLQLYEAAELLARERGVLLLDLQRDIEAEFDHRMASRQPPPSPGEIARERAREGWAVIRARPMDWAWMHMRTSLASLLPAETFLSEALGATRGGRGTLSVLHREGLFAAVNHYFQGRLWFILLLAPLLLVSFTIYALIAAAGIDRLRGGLGDRGRLLAIVTVVLLFAAGPAAEPRFRTPVSPIMSVAAGAGVLALGRWRKSRRSGSQLPEPE